MRFSLSLWHAVNTFSTRSKNAWNQAKNKTECTVYQFNADRLLAQTTWVVFCKFLILKLINTLVAYSLPQIPQMNQYSGKILVLVFDNAPIHQGFQVSKICSHLIICWEVIDTWICIVYIMVRFQLCHLCSVRQTSLLVFYLISQQEPSFQVIKTQFQEA